MSALAELNKKTTSKTTPKSGNSALSQLTANRPIKTTEQEVSTKFKEFTFPAFLGGGAYNVNLADPKSIGKTPKELQSERDYAGVKTEEGKNRDHIFPVSLGGSNTNNKNIRLVKTKDNPAKFEADIAEKVKKGELSLAAGRLAVITYKQQQIMPLKTTTKGNFLSSLSDLIQLPLKKTADFTVKNALQPTADAFNETIGERIGAVGRSIQGKSLTPLKESFSKQYHAMNPDEPGLSKKEKLDRLTNIALMVGVDAGLNTKGLRENTPLQSGRPKIEPSDIQKNPVIANLENQVSKAQELQPKFPSDTQGGALENLAKTTSRQEKVGSQVNKLDTTYSKGITQPQESVNLHQEALKYKSANEFVKAQGTPVYHGTNNTFTEFDPKRIGSRDSGWFGKGFYFAGTKGEAATYGKNVMESYLKMDKPFDFSKFESKNNKGYSHADTFYLSNIAKEIPEVGKKLDVTIYDKITENGRVGKSIPLADYIKKVENTKIPYRIYEGDGFNIYEIDNPLTGRKEDIRFTEGKKFDKGELKYILFDTVYKTDSGAGGLYGVEKKIADDMGDSFTQELQKRGYDGTIQSPYGDEYVAFKPEQIKTKSQLTDIWNKAHETKVQPIEVPKVQTQKIGTPKISDNIVKPPIVRGKLESPQLDFTKWKDTNPIGLARETFDRNIERVAGSDAPKLKQFITEPIRANETKRVEFLNNTRKEIRSLMKDTGIKVGSKEDALIQRYGEGNITLQDLKAETPKWQEVQKSSNFFRQKYDNLLSMVNAERENFGYKPIPKRADYFRHFEEINNVISQMGVLFRENDLPTHLSGITNIFKPGKPFSTAELARKGGTYTESAIKGMDNYIEAISKQAFHIDSVQRVRALEKYIRTAGEAGQAKLPNFVANISEYANLIAGKKALLDRAVESIMGRKSFSVLSALKNRFSSNTVVGNISSALTNFIPLTTQFPATTGKKQVAQGLYEAFISPFLKNPLSIGDVKSGFLTRRFPDAAIVGQKIFGSTKLGKGAEYASSLFNAVDFFTARSVVAGKYYENIAKGLDTKIAMQQADDYAAKLIADRSIGQTPNLFNTKTLGVVTQFQLEVNNMVSFALRDIPNMSKGSKLKLASQLGQFVLYSYLFNTVFEQMTGRRPTIDPIQSILQTIGQTKDTKGMPVKPRLSKAGKDFAGNLPFGNIFVEGGRLPIASAFPNVGGLLKGDTTLSKEGIKILTYIVSPFGGSQIKKTIEGVKAYKKGEVDTKDGKKQFDIPKTPANFARTSVFGKYSVPNASQYFNSKAIKATQPKKEKTTKEKKPAKAKTFKY